MKLGLFIPCYVDQFYPQVGIATLELLEKLNLTVDYPSTLSCCGQPMANAGFEHLSETSTKLFYKAFQNFDYVVSPSGSCVLHLKEQLHHHKDSDVQQLSGKVKELTEFLTDVIQVKDLQARFPYRVGVHQSCHGQRGLHLSQMSELVAPPFSKTESLLNMVEGLALIPLERKDECCGFGGSFCVTEESVSVKMGKDRITDHINHNVEYITGNDMSCLMHLEGILRRQKNTVRVIHISEILNAGNHERKE